MNIFYVYEHWRPDKDLCFWVGKGKGRRAYNFKRNKHYNRIVKKLERLGMCVEVRMVASGLFEKAAFELEKERIIFWRAFIGKNLTNLTDGGEGSSGIKFSKKRRSEISAKSKMLRHSDNAKKSISYAARNRSKGYWENISIKLSGKPLSKKHCAALREAAKTRPHISEATRYRMCVAQQRRGKRSDKTRAKQSASMVAVHARRKAAKLAMTEGT